MKQILTTLILFTGLFAQSQMFIGNSKATFKYSSLVRSAVMDLSNPTGTTIIEGKKFTNPSGGAPYGSGVNISGGSGKVILRNCSFEQTSGEAFQMENFGSGATDTIIIQNNFFGNTKCGVYFLNCSAVFIIEYNQQMNPHGARGGKGQFFQSNACTMYPGSVIRFNRIKSYPGEGYSEDLISSFATSGTNTSNPFRIYKNISDGGGPSASGGGFITGDGDGDYVNVESNVLRNPGNYVQSLAGGSYLISRNNIGYQATWSFSPNGNIAQYTYVTGASAYCNNLTMTNNRIGLQSGTNYYCYCTPTCGDVTGIDEGEGNADVGWRSTNFDNVTIDTINRYMPTRMMTFLSEDDEWRIRDSIPIFRWATGAPGYISPGANGEWPPSPDRPTANAGADQNITTSSTTLTGTGGTTHRWVRVSGPNSPTIVSPTSASTSITGMVAGTYIFRYEAYDADDGNANVVDDGGSDADWVSVTTDVSS